MRGGLWAYCREMDGEERRGERREGEEEEEEEERRMREKEKKKKTLAIDPILARGERFTSIFDC
jgi:hypothetical protein